MKKIILDKWIDLCNRDDTSLIKSSIENANCACFISDYEETIECFFDKRTLILGGDAFFKKGAIYHFDGSGWYYNGDCPQESREKTRDYLEKLSHQKDIIVTFITKTI